MAGGLQLYGNNITHSIFEVILYVNDWPLLSTVTLVWTCPLEVSSYFPEVFDFVLKCFNLGTKKICNKYNVWFIYYDNSLWHLANRVNLKIVVKISVHSPPGPHSSCGLSRLWRTGRFLFHNGHYHSSRYNTWTTSKKNNYTPLLQFFSKTNDAMGD